MTARRTLEGLSAFAAIAALAATPTSGEPASGAGGLAIETIPNRADLVSGGDVLVRIHLPTGADAAKASLTLNGKSFREPESYFVAAKTAPKDGALHPSGDGKTWLALVGGLAEGKNTLALTSGGKTVKLEVTDHPNGGPLFSGPQIQPWPCKAGATDKQCSRPTTYSFSYMPASLPSLPSSGAGAPVDGSEARTARGAAGPGAASPFKPYDPASPPTDIAQVTTTTGQRVPYIVRTETLTQDRSGVQVAVLFNPAEGWSA